MIAQPYRKKRSIKSLSSILTTISKTELLIFSKVLKGLKEDGELLVIDFKKQEGPGPPVAMKMSADFITKELTQAGFTQFEVNDTLLDHQYIIRAK